MTILRRVRHRGVTLVELTIVMVITVTLAAIAAPRYGGAIARYRIQLAAERIADDLRQAMAVARQTGASVIVRFDDTTDSYHVTGAAALDGSANLYEVDLAEPPYRVSLDSASFPGDGPLRVIFDGHGDPDGGGSVIISLGSLRREITLGAANGSVTVTTP